MKNSQFQRAFTLIEILVVLFIIGLSAMILVPNLSNQDGVIAKEEAKRFLKLMKLAQEQAIFQGVELGLIVEPEGYHFMQYEGDKWQDISDSAFKPRKRHKALRYELRVEGELNIQARKPKKSKKNSAPQILILSSGEITPFVLVFMSQSQKEAYRVEANVTEEISLWRKNEKLSGSLH